jgi:hypothetical protein
MFNNIDSNILIVWKSLIVLDFMPNLELFNRNI